MTGPKRVTDKQLAANRANAQHSLGPRTPGGIAVSRYNALQHGILAQAVIPEALDPYESRQAFQELLATLRDEFAPANSVEELLVEGIATAYWRLARVYRAEAGAIAQAQDAIRRMRENPSPLDLLDSFGRTPPPDALKQRLQRLEACKNNKTRLRKAVVDEDPSMAEASDDQVAAAAEQEMTDLDRQIDERDRREAAHRQAVDSAAHSLPDMDQALSSSSATRPPCRTSSIAPSRASSDCSACGVASLSRRLCASTSLGTIPPPSWATSKPQMILGVLTMACN